MGKRTFQNALLVRLQPELWSNAAVAVAAAAAARGAQGLYHGRRLHCGRPSACRTDSGEYQEYRMHLIDLIESSLGYVYVQYVLFISQLRLDSSWPLRL